VKTVFENQQPAEKVVYVEREEGFPWGTIIGLGILAGIAGVTYWKWDEIKTYIDKVFYVKGDGNGGDDNLPPPADEEWCEKEQKNIPKKDWTAARCDVEKPTTGTLSGYVTGDDYAPLKGVIVNVKSTDGSYDETKYTADKWTENGMTMNIKFTNVPFGGYYITWAADCYQSYGPKYVELNEMQNPGDISTGMSPLSYENFAQDGAFDSVERYFCTPRKLDKIVVSVAYKCWAYNWAGTDIYLLDENGNEVHVSEYNHVCQAWESKGPDRIDHIIQSVNGAPLATQPTKWKGIRIRKRHSGEIKDWRITTSYI